MQATNIYKYLLEYIKISCELLKKLFLMEILFKVSEEGYIEARWFI